MNRVRMSVPTSWITRVEMPSTMFHATPWAACLAIDMRSAEPFRHPPGDSVDQRLLGGELGEGVAGRRKIHMVELAAQCRKHLEHLIRMIVARAVDPREDGKDADTPIDEPGELSAERLDRRQLPAFARRILDGAPPEHRDRQVHAALGDPVDP